ncbi:MAG TPA: hypothetical protein PK163_09385 [Steroidobacteraceae bacterium]|nr:hypothetical protein [Steroidobacteraceae bacterium]
MIYKSFLAALIACASLAAAAQALDPETPVAQPSPLATAPAASPSGAERLG